MGKTKTPPTLAARVRYVRGLVPGLSMRTLSRIADLSPSMVGEIERGNRTKIEHPTGVKLAEAFGVRFDWLWSGTGESPEPEAITARLVSELGALPPRGKSGPKPKPKTVRS